MRGVKAKRLGDRRHEGGPCVLEPNSPPDLGLDRTHGHGHLPAVGKRPFLARDAVGKIERRADVHESARGDAPAAGRQADGGYEAGTAAEPVNTRVTHWAAAKTSQRLFQALFEPVHTAPHGVGGEPQVDERCEHRHAYLAGAVENRPAAAAGEPYRELPRGQFLVGDRDVSPRPEPPDCDAGLEFEDDKRGIAAPGRRRLAREPLGQNGVAMPVDPAGQPDRERPGRRGGGAMHRCRLLKPGH